jgi:glycerol-3-phosphate cytidylyltransferase
VTRRVITFGTYDVLHIGHVNLLLRAHDLGDHLTVGVSSDELNLAKKGRLPVYPQAERLAIVSSLACVDDVFLEESLEAKRDYIVEHAADVLVMGSDWEGAFDDLADVVRVVYLPRTEGVSTSGIITSIRDDDT